MGKFKTLVLMTFHENKECLRDNIQNVINYCDHPCIIINDGSTESLDDLKSDIVHIIKRKNKMNYYDTMIPIHLEMWDYIVENNIISEYVLFMASNQLLIKFGFFDYMKKYRCGFGRRILINNHLNEYARYKEFKFYYNDIGESYFKYQSNHDGIFATYDLCNDMLNYLYKYKNTITRPHHEEFLYPAYLLKHSDGQNIADFSEYNYIDLSKKQLTLADLKVCVDNQYYIVKRISRNSINDEVRKYIRERNVK